MKPRSAPARAGTADLLLAVGWLTACRGGDVVTDSPPKPVDELSRHHGDFCLQTMPRASPDSHGFGTEAAASNAPGLWKPQEAWVCRYVPDDVTSSGSNGAWYEWVLAGTPRRLGAGELEALSTAVEQLTQPPRDRACTDDLGCGDVRLTDDPFTSVPGEPSRSGTVAGVLADPTGLLDRLAPPRS